MIKEHSLADQLASFYPVVKLNLQFAATLFNQFEKWEAQHNKHNNKGYNWEPAYKEWVAKNAGLLWVQEDNKGSYYIFDQKLYAFALLRYS